ncbi:GroES-like protein [Hypoxylon rubiginosum]|uniref:GroES-like protein n=1 Tax=Hypoxylon rubiginosum TaxID=110542 RepID=A0ACC0D3S0_9PEZI|nr:GroES-like protein [Hypoxylon rubiginosum]
MAQGFVQIPSPSNRIGELVTYDVPSLVDEDGSVLVQFLAAPVNRVDVMALSGQYPVKPRYTIKDKLVPGFDGCGMVLESTSSKFEKGDLVLPRELGLGTWRTHAVLPDTVLMKLPPRIRPLDAALLRSGALVAWLLIEELAPLKPGDYIMMSAGTSCVAQFLVQLARLKGINTILIIRNRDSIVETRNKLLGLGATAVLAEEDLCGMKSPLIGKITLALDCVFGTVGQNMVSWLAPVGKYVLVGMLGGQETGITVNTKHLFYRQLSFVPFRSSDVLKRMGDEKVEQLVTKIACLLIDGTLQPPDVNTVRWDQHEKEDLEQSLLQAMEMVHNGEVGYKKTVWIL